MEIGVFLPIGNNGWLISKTSPQYKPTFELNRAVIEKAEAYGFDFALSMIKLRGFGGESEYWDYNLESFTLMAGLAAVTKRIKLFATAAVLTLPPAIVARMAVTIDSIAPGRFGVNVVTGWQKAEYAQMGLWPGEQHFEHRYDYCAEYVQVMRDLWSTGASDLKGQFFTMDDCRLLPKPAQPIEIISAGQSNAGMDFAARYADYNFLSGGSKDQAAGLRAQVDRLNAATAASGRTVGALALIMIIADATDEAANAKWELYKQGVDLDAIAWRDGQASADKRAEAHSTAGRMLTEQNNLPTNIATFIGSYATVAAQLDRLAEVQGLRGVMLTFDNFLIGMDQFGRHIQPLMQCRADAKSAA